MSQPKSLPKTLTADQAIGTAQAYGERLGWLIASLNVGDELKENLLALLPQMTPEQLERLANLLESAFLSEQTGAIDAKLKQELAKIKLDDDLKQAKLADGTAKSLEEVEQKLLHLSNKS